MQIKVSKVAKPQFMASLKKLMQSPAIPARTAFKLRTLAKTVAEEALKYDAIREGYVSEFGVRDPKTKELIIDTLPSGGKAVRIDPKKRKACAAKIEELEQLTVEIPEVKLDDLVGKDGAEPDLTPEDYVHLEFIVETLP